MYNLVIYVYALGVAILSVFNKKVRKMRRGEHATFKVLRDNVDTTARYIWFHAASLGEFEQGRVLMERLRAKHPECKILLTFFSPSGYEVRKDYNGADIVCYLPLDTVANARRFLRAVRPVMAFFIKYEFWYNYLHILKHRNIPVYSVSSIFRPSQMFFKWYGKPYANVLKCFTHFFVQNDQSKQLLGTIGINKVTVVGDTRFDRVLQIKENAAGLPVIEAFKGGHKLFVAGSSWVPDEEILIKYFNEHTDWRLIIAPHVIGEERTRQILSRLKRSTVTYSKATIGDVSMAGCLIMDCFGLLSRTYKYADVAYIGGGFGVGIHNVVEAAVWGVPVIFGPNNQRFQEAQDLLACGGGVEISDYATFETAMDGLIADDNLRQSRGAKTGEYVKGRAGAVSRILAIADDTLRGVFR